VTKEEVDATVKVNFETEAEEQYVLVKGTGRQLTLNEHDFDMVKEDFGAAITEGERGDSGYSFTGNEGKGLSLDGLGYNTLLTSNNQKVLGEGICRSIILGSTMPRIDLEAEESSIIVLSKEKKFNGQPGKRNGKSKREKFKFCSYKTAEVLDLTTSKELNVWDVCAVTILKNMLWNILDGIVNSKRGIGEHENRILIKLTGHHLALDGQKLGIEEDFGAVYIEGEREDSMYGFNTTEDEGKSLDGQSYNTLITSNNQKVQGGRICWSKYLGSTVLRIGLEVEESSIVMMSRRRKFNRQMKMIIEESKEKYFESIVCELMNLLDWTSEDDLIGTRCIKVLNISQLEKMVNRSEITEISTLEARK
jgi:hypothetical protein